MMDEKMEELLRLKTWAVQGNSNAPDNLFDWLHADNRYPQHRGREAALALITDLVDQIAILSPPDARTYYPNWATSNVLRGDE